MPLRVVASYQWQIIFSAMTGGCFRYLAVGRRAFHALPELDSTC